jgi:hypothetical protein
MYKSFRSACYGLALSLSLAACHPSFLADQESSPSDLTADGKTQCRRKPLNGPIQKNLSHPGGLLSVAQINRLAKVRTDGNAQQKETARRLLASTPINFKADVVKVSTFSIQKPRQ